MVLDAAPDETVLDTQSIPDPVVSVRHHHSFAQNIILWNFVCGIKSLLRPTQKYLVHGADRGSDQALQKKCRMPTVMSEKKWTSQSDKMMRCTFFYTRPALHSWKAVFPMWRTTAQHLGVVSGLSGLQKPGSGTSHARRRAARVSFFRKWLTLRASIKRITNQPKKWKVVCGPGRFSELRCVDLGVVRTRAGVTRADVSANGTQAGLGSVFSSRTLARNSLQSPMSKVRGQTQDRARFPRNDSCHALSHLQAGDPQMAPCLCITCVLSVL